MSPSLDIGGFLNSFDFSSIGSTVLNILVIVMGILVVGGMIGGFIFWRKKSKKNNDPGMTVVWFRDINGNTVDDNTSAIEEVLIPGSSLRLFYNPKKDQWMPRFSRESKPKTFYVSINKYGDLINFTIQSIDKSLTQAKMNFDHTDARWASELAREYIKTNYRKKAEKWWQAYQGLITNLALIIVITCCFLLILWMMKGLFDRAGMLIDHADALVQSSKQTLAPATGQLITVT